MASKSIENYKNNSKSVEFKKESEKIKNETKISESKITTKLE